MKTLLIAFSLCANFALGIAIWQRSTTNALTPAASAPNSNRPATDPTWSDIAPLGDDLRWVAKLQSEGFSPTALRALVRWRIKTKYAPRLLELAAKDNETPYWRTAAWSYWGFDPETRAKRRALQDEMANELKILLGADAEPPETEWAKNRRLRSYGNIPPAKIQAVHAILTDYSELSRNITETAKGAPLREDREKLAYLEKEKRADLMQALTPEELDEYDRRNSPAARTIRERLRYMDLNESEFLSLYRLQRDFDERYGRDHLTGKQADVRKDAEKQLQAEFELALGPERFTDYQITTDGNYPNTHSFLESAGLPTTLARDLIVLQQSTVRQVESLKSENSVSPNDLRSRLEALQKQVDTQLTALLGDEVSTSYKKRAGGWLAKLDNSKPASSR